MRGVTVLGRVFEATLAENRRAILRLLPRDLGGELLEIGPGDGAFTARVAAHTGAERIVAVELRPERAQAARARGIETVVADVEAGLAFADGRFRLVHANQVIEHIRATDGFLREVHRVLEPGGLACISTNNLASWHNVLSLACGWQPMPAHVSDEVIVGNPANPYDRTPHGDPGLAHVRLFAPRALRDLCEHHGLDVLAVRAAGYYPLPPLIARAAVRVDPRHSAFMIALARRAAG